MHIEPRLWTFTRGVRLRIAWTVLIGLIASALGVARLGLLGWLIGALFAGQSLAQLLLPIVAIAAVMVLRGVFEHWRAMVAHETAARVQVSLRRVIYEKIASLGPGAVGRQRSGALTLSLIDGVEQLETYFGQFLPQFLISAAVAGPDLRGHRLHRPAGRGGHAGVRADRPVRAGAVAQVRRRALAGSAEGLRDLRRRVPRIRSRASRR